MIIKVFINDISSKKIIKNKKKVLIDIDEQSTMKELKEKLGIPDASISFDKHYKMNSKVLVSLENIIPFVIREEGIVEWDLNLEQITLQEFSNSNNINLSKGIYIEYGYVQAGGPGFLKDIYELWAAIHPCLEFLATIDGCIGLVKLIKKCFKKKVPNPHSFAEYIYKQDKWSHVILANQLQIDNERSKNILKLFGYEWNNSEKLYVISKVNKKKMIKKINKIDLFGRGGN